MKKFKFDFILIAILVASLIIWIVAWTINSSKENKKAIIDYDGNTIMEVSLDKDQEIKLYDLGNGKTLKYEMVIVVENNTIRVSENNCPNHDCIKEGKKDKIGDVIVCLPNKIIIRIVKA